MTAMNYLKRCFKKNAGYLPSTLLLTVILSVLLVIVFGVMFSFDDKEDVEVSKSERLGVGIVGDMDDKYIAPGIEMVKRLDVSEDYLNIVTFTDEQQAVSALENGEIVGYLFIPEEFLSSIRHGNNTPARYVSKNSPVDLGPIIVNDVLGTISNLVVESQSGIFAMENFYKEYGVKGRGKALNAINLKYLRYVFSRDDFTEVTEIGRTGSVSLGGYYVGGLIVIIVLLVGVLSASCVIKRDLSLSRLLSTKGCGSTKQVVCEYFSFVMLPMAAVFLIMLFLGIFSAFNDLGIDELYGYKFIDYMVLFVKFLPMIAVISSMQFLVYELCTNVVSATLLQFVVSISLAYVSGCFYPKNFFPTSLQKISSLLPVGCGFDYVNNILSDFFDLQNLLFCLGYAVLFLALSSVVRNIKIRSRMV